MRNTCCHRKFTCKENIIFFVEHNLMHRDIKDHDDDASCVYGVKQKQRICKQNSDPIDIPSQAHHHIKDEGDHNDDGHYRWSTKTKSDRKYKLKMKDK